MEIMTNATPDPWLTGRTWRIVRADLNLAPVFMPLSSFTFKAAPPKDGISGYTIAHTYQAPEPDLFEDIFLRPVGSSEAKFQTITNKPLLPLYTEASATEYAEVSAEMAEYVANDPELHHLESVIMVPCHAHGPVGPGNVSPSHSPLWAETTIHVYQFSNVVKGDLPLLLIRAVLSPDCPANGGGTATGYG
jgi:hypothetical protein